jgi:acyl dehydratase
MQGKTMQDKVIAEGKLCHEDLEVGKVFAFGRAVVTEEEIVAFARAYDPQVVDGDAQAAKSSIVGLVCASGLHICAIMMRMVCDGFLNRVASLGSPGVDEVCFVKPVRPGDVVSMRYTALEKRVLASRPDVGMSKILAELRNETGETMATWRTNQLTRMRHPDPVARPGTTGARRGVVSLWERNGLPQAPAATGCFLEDRQIGETSDLGGHRFNKDAMIAFARQFDPQPFHLDEEAAKASLFGNLSASGWQTAAYLIRQIVLARQQTAAEARAAGVRMAAYGPSSGFTNLLWPKPVFVGDTVEYRTRVVGKVDLTSHPDRGVLVEEAQGRNQKGEIVLALTMQILVERRPVDGA